MAKQKKVQYTAAIGANRFPLICKTLSPKIDKSEDYVVAYNKKTNECACFHWDVDFRVGKKTLLGTAFHKKELDSSDKGIPLFDEYASGFSGCDKFNRTLHGRTWPHRNTSDMAAAFDYMFTSTLVNCFHLWIDADEQRNEITFEHFCLILAQGMMEELKG